MQVFLPFLKLESSFPGIPFPLSQTVSIVTLSLSQPSTFYFSHLVSMARPSIPVPGESGPGDCLCDTQVLQGAPRGLWQLELVNPVALRIQYPRPTQIIIVEVSP